MRTIHRKELPANWKPVSQIFAALGDATRQKILLLFEPGEELSIKDIVDALDLARSTAVHHLGVLEKSGLLVSRKAGKESLYSTVPDVALNALEDLKSFILEHMVTSEA